MADEIDTLFENVRSQYSEADKVSLAQEVAVVHTILSRAHGIWLEAEGMKNYPAAVEACDVYERSAVIYHALEARLEELNGDPQLDEKIEYHLKNARDFRDGVLTKSTRRNIKGKITSLPSCVCRVG